MQLRQPKNVVKVTQVFLQCIRYTDNNCNSNTGLTGKNVFVTVLGLVFPSFSLLPTIEMLLLLQLLCNKQKVFHRQGQEQGQRQGPTAYHRFYWVLAG